jgi:large subunit ribosomal protein L9
MKTQYLLIEDIDSDRRSGDLVAVKPGYARNFLLPQKKAVIATKFTLRKQAQLQEERRKRAVVDRGESEKLAERIGTLVLECTVKVDQEGHMYGSVTQLDIVHLFEKEGIQLERKNIILPHPIKTTGEHVLTLRLKEGVPATCQLKVVSEQVVEGNKE